MPPASPDAFVRLLLGGLLGLCVLVPVTLAAVPAIRARSWRLFPPALGRVAALVAVPLPVFLLSAFVAPDSKSACRMGWVDCLHAGKLWLTPLVLWAIAALYERDVLRRPGRPPSWSRLGILWGAIVSGFCLLHFVGLTFASSFPHVSISAATDGIFLFLLVPCYVHAWFLWRSWQLWRDARPSWKSLAAGLGLGLPCWITAVLSARRMYAQLPETSGCFVVTAASRGHRAVVGPCGVLWHNGRLRPATRQLATFWLFEAAWQRVSPRTHTFFRYFYNRVGPALARMIRKPWQADLACLMLLPAELAARCALRIARRGGFQSLELLPRGESNHWKSP